MFIITFFFKYTLFFLHKYKYSVWLGSIVPFTLDFECFFPKLACLNFLRRRISKGVFKRMFKPFIDILHTDSKKKMPYEVIIDLFASNLNTVSSSHLLWMWNMIHLNLTSFPAVLCVFCASLPVTSSSSSTEIPFHALTKALHRPTIHLCDPNTISASC